MGVFKNWQGSQRLIDLLIIQFICWLGWLVNIALAQTELSESVSGSFSSFPDVGLACIGNLAVFVVSLLRGRLDLEMGARDILATIRGSKLEDVNDGYGLTTSKEYDKASVVMLSNHAPNLSIRQFMKYISNAYNVHSIILQCFPVKSPALNAETSNSHSESCKCIIFSTVEEVAILLARQIPRTLKRLSDSLFLLPSQDCLKNGCHECKRGLLYVDNNKLIEGDFQFGNTILTEHEYDKVAEMKRSAVVETVGSIFGNEEHNCMCIPLYPSGYDYWTKLLIRSFGVRVSEGAHENYSTASLIVPRFAEVSMNFVLTGWFRVDGFTSSLIARRAIKDYVVDDKGSGFAANAFLTKVQCKVIGDYNINVCQVLTFRGTLLGIRSLSFAVGFVNFFCFITWAVLIAIDSRPGKWYNRHFPPLSIPRVAVILGTIGIVLGMDCFHLYLYFRRSDRSKRLIAMVLGVMVLEIMAIVAISVTTATLGMNFFGKRLHSALHVLVWVKWAAGSYLLGEYPPEYDSELNYDNGILVYSSVFLLNSVFAAVRGKWVYSVGDKS